VPEVKFHMFHDPGVNAEKCYVDVVAVYMYAGGDGDAHASVFQQAENPVKVTKEETSKKPKGVPES
jgi:hypothetical protein